ncbi:MAG: type VI secretion system domain-containing protein, partial [bacterium]|nr:type VI secretion system domain-containing protein [bacterium]
RQWETLLTAAESQFPSFWFWLDLQMYVHDALDNLGLAYHSARDAVRFETAFFLRRMPFFPNLNSQDGTPIASDETREWLTDLESSTQQSSAGAGSTVVAVSDSANAEAFELNQAESIDNVLTSAREYLENSRSLRDRFIAQLKLSGYLAGKKEIELAYTYLTGLESSMTKFGLDQWEPALAVAVLSELYSCLQKLIKSRKEDKESLQQKTRETVARLVAIDPVKAAELVRK